jgi:hypothetical protein
MKVATGREGADRTMPFDVSVPSLGLGLMVHGDGWELLAGALYCWLLCSGGGSWVGSRHCARCPVAAASLGVLSEPFVDSTTLSTWVLSMCDEVGSALGALGVQVARAAASPGSRRFTMLARLDATARTYT